MPVTQPVNHSLMEVAKGVRETVNQDGAVLLDIDQGLCFSLNPVGTRIWEMIKAGRSVDEIADKLGEEFALPRTQTSRGYFRFFAPTARQEAGRRAISSRGKAWDLLPISWPAPDCLIVASRVHRSEV